MDAGWLTIHYLDDFLAIPEGGPNIDNDKYELFFYYLCNQLGLSINIKKNAPETLTGFLDVKMNIVQIKTHLPPHKLLNAKK